jgi:hypothetical protein
LWTIYLNLGIFCFNWRTYGGWDINNAEGSKKVFTEKKLGGLMPAMQLSFVPKSANGLQSIAVRQHNQSDSLKLDPGGRFVFACIYRPEWQRFAKQTPFAKVTFATRMAAT